MPQGRVGTPLRGNPPRMYTLLRYRNDLAHVCGAAEQRELPPAYPPTMRLNTHVRAQLSAALCLENTAAAPDQGDRGDQAAASRSRSLDATAAAMLRTADAFVETKYDGFRLQLHWEDGATTLQPYAPSRATLRAQPCNPMRPAG